MDKVKHLVLVGEKIVKYADVGSNGKSININIRISGGLNALFQPQMLILKNQYRSYPVRGIPNDVPGVFYRTSTKELMDYQV